MNLLKEQYEKHPFPNYPLFLKPRWQEGYTCSASFSRGLCGIRGTYNKVLVLGCGDTFPYVLNRWEPNHIKVDYVDFSSSSLSRAKKRTFFQNNLSTFVNEDIKSFLNTNRKQKYDHIDIYGVLHHVDNPSYILNRCNEILEDDGTIRLMVYNSKSRSWIHFFQDIFRSLELKFDDEGDLKKSKTILNQVSKRISYFSKIITKSKTSNPSILVDTFFNQKELILEAKTWQNSIETSEFRIQGLFDRYGELDHLKNPLWSLNNIENLEDWIDSGVFENNFELFLTKSSFKPKAHKESRLTHIHDLGIQTFQKIFAGYAKNVFNFPETGKLSFIEKNQIWKAFIEFLYLKIKPADNFYEKFDITCLQRLARVGIILKDMVPDPTLLGKLNQPIDSTSPVYNKTSFFTELDQISLIIADVFPNLPKSELDQIVQKSYSRVFNKKDPIISRQKLSMKSLNSIDSAL